MFSYFKEKNRIHRAIMRRIARLQTIQEEAHSIEKELMDLMERREQFTGKSKFHPSAIAPNVIALRFEDLPDEVQAAIRNRAEDGECGDECENCLPDKENLH